MRLAFLEKISSHLRLILLIGTMLISGALIPFVYNFFTKGPVFQIESLKIHGNKIVTDKELDVYLEDLKGQPLYGVRFDQIEEKIAEHPWVKSVVIRRAPPHTIHLYVTERKPTAVITLDKDYLVDEDGQLFKVASAKDMVDIPTIKGMTSTFYEQFSEQAKELIGQAAMAAHTYRLTKKPAGRLSILAINEAGDLTAYFENGLEVVLGVGEFNKKWTLLAQVLYSLESKGKQVEFVYLSKPDNNSISVRFKDKPSVSPGKNGVLKK